MPDCGEFLKPFLRSRQTMLCCRRWNLKPMQLTGVQPRLAKHSDRPGHIAEKLSLLRRLLAAKSESMVAWSKRWLRSSVLPKSCCSCSRSAKRFRACRRFFAVANRSAQKIQVLGADLSSSFVSGHCRMGGSGRRDASSNFGEETPPANGGRLWLQGEGFGGSPGMGCEFSGPRSMLWFQTSVTSSIPSRDIVKCSSGTSTNCARYSFFGHGLAC